MCVYFGGQMPFVFILFILGAHSLRLLLHIYLILPKNGFEAFDCVKSDFTVQCIQVRLHHYYSNVFAEREAGLKTF